MKSIKEKATEYDRIAKQISPNESIVDISGRKQFEAGANYVLEQIENFMKDLNLGNSAEEKFYKLDVLAYIGLFIEQLKK